MEGTYMLIDGKLVKATKLMLLKNKIHGLITRFKVFIDGQKYIVIPREDIKYYFRLSPKEYKDAQKIYNEKGTISYTFYPAGGIGWGVKLEVLKTGEIIDISDICSW